MAQAVQPAGPSAGQLQELRASAAYRVLQAVQEVRPTGPSMGLLRERRAWVAWVAFLEERGVRRPASGASVAFPGVLEERRA